MTKILLSLVALVVIMGCRMPMAQKGGVASIHQFRSSIEQGENPSTPSKLEQTRNFERTFTAPEGSVLLSWNSLTDAPVTNASAIRLSKPTLIVEREVTGAAAHLGAAQKDEARTLAARLTAMRPIQWTGIALCVGSIAAFYFGWPSLGFLAIAIGGGMIVTAAIVPGHETLILSVCGIGFALVALAIVYAYSKGKLDSNKNGVPDFLEKLA